MWQMLQGYRPRVALSLLLILGEAVGQVVLPFAIGVAVNDYLRGSHRGLILFGVLGLSTMLLATVRRLHDVRLYSRIYEQVGTIDFSGEAGLSEKTARLNMLREVIDFLEHSMPEMIGSLAGFVGTLVFLAALSVPVFLAALVTTALIAAIYATTTRRTVSLNREYNDEYARQVDVLQGNDAALTRHHIRLLDIWTIRLSDVDAVNYALSLTLTVALQLFAIVTAARHGMDQGTLLAVVLYVFEFSASASLLPFSWQEYLRLRDILTRLRAVA